MSEPSTASSFVPSVASGSHDERKTLPLEQSIEPGELNDTEVRDEDGMQGGQDAESGTALWFSLLLQVSKHKFKCQFILRFFRECPLYRSPLPKLTLTLPRSLTPTKLCT
jgi:hypothetical protein